MSAGTPKRDLRSSQQRAIDAAVAITNAEVTKRRAEASVEYEQATAGAKFTKEFNAALEARMRDRLQTIVVRVESWIRRYAHGEYSLFAIRDDGHPRLQVDCERELSIDKRAVSKAVAYMQCRGYLLDDPKLLVPAIKPELTGPDPETATTKEWAAFVDEWRVANSTDFSRLEDARSTVKQIRKVMREAFKAWHKSEATATNDDASLYRPTSEQLTDPARSQSSTPFEESVNRQAAKKKKKRQNPSVDGGKQSGIHSARIAALEADWQRLLDEENRVLDKWIENGSTDDDELGAATLELREQRKTVELEIVHLKRAVKASVPSATERIVSEAKQTLEARDRIFTEIAELQRKFKNTSFAKPLIDRESREHQTLVNLILDRLQKHGDDYLTGFFMLVNMRFRGIALGGKRVEPRAPGRPKGPDGMGLLVNWAEDYARIELGRGLGAGK